MANFSAGANAFLSSPFLDKTIGPNPATERGKGLHINAHPTLPMIIYPSGRFIVVKNLANPSECFIYRGHSAPTTVAKFSPNGFWVASADSIGKVRVWSWDNPEHLTKLETSVFAGSISDLDWDFESKKLVVAGEGSGILVKCITWDTGNSAGEMMGHNKRVLSVAYKPTRPFRVMSGGDDMKTVFFAGPPFKLDHSNNSVHTNFVNSVRYAPNGSKVVSVGTDKKIQMYDGATGQPTAEVANAHDGGIYSVAFSADSNFIITASADKTVKLWNAETLALEQTFQIASDPQVADAQLSCLWTPQNQLISVSLNGNVNLLDRANTAAPARIIQAHQVAITSMYIDLATSTLYTGSFDGVVIARDITPGNENNATRLIGTDKRNVYGGAHGNKVVGIAVKSGEVISVGWDDAMRFASPESKTYNGETATNGQPQALATSPNSDLVLLVTNSEVSLYRGETKVGTLPAGSMKYSPTTGAILDDSEIAVGGSDNKTHVYSISSGMAFTEVAAIETRSAISALAYSPNGEFLAIGDVGRQVEVYERGTWNARVKGKWSFHTSRVTSLAWCPNGQYLASGSLDENIYIWNLNNVNKKLQLGFAHMGGVSGLGWLNEERLVSVGNDHVTATWKIPASALEN